MTWIVALFCVEELVRNNTAEVRQVYLPVLSGILGFWLPSPLPKQPKADSAASGANATHTTRAENP